MSCPEVSSRSFALRGKNYPLNLQETSEGYRDQPDLQGSGKLNGPDLVNTAWVFSTVGQMDAPSFEAVARAAERHVGDLSTLDLTNPASDKEALEARVQLMAAEAAAKAEALRAVSKEADEKEQETRPGQ